MIFIITLLAFTGLLQAADPIRVSVDVGITETTPRILKARLTSHFLRELRKLPDIEVLDSNPDYLIEVLLMDLKDGRFVASVQVTKPLEPIAVLLTAYAGLREEFKVDDVVKDWEDRIQKQMEERGWHQIGEKVNFFLSFASDTEEWAKDLVAWIDTDIFEKRRQSRNILEGFQPSSGPPTTIDLRSKTETPKPIRSIPDPQPNPETPKPRSFTEEDFQPRIFSEEDFADSPKRSVSGGLYSSIEEGHWVSKNLDSGYLIKLEDGSLWEISPIDRIDTSLWLVTEEITVTNSGNPMYPYKLINTDTKDVVEAKLLSQ